MGMVEVAAFAASAGGRHDHVHTASYQFERQSGQVIIFILCPSVFNCDILVLDIPGFG
jgi:hypothetical protein